MAANIPGAANVNPGTYSVTDTISSGTSVPGGLRIAALIGEGARREVLVANAQGAGADGLDPTYSSTTGQDGRHFRLTYYPITSNRLSLYLEGVRLNGLEQDGFLNAGSTFSYSYDYRYDTDYGYIEMQAAHLVDQGGLYYSVGSTNVGTGTINGLSLLDDNAPSETWTVRCSSVLRDGVGNPIDGYARFVATGSVSGMVLDGYGNQVIWQSNGVAKNNTILQFSISEGATAFREGDSFYLEVESGVLSAGDTLIATYIPTADLNDPEFFSNMDDVQAKHGAASTTNCLSLGCQIAFANNPPGILCCQAAPAIPRRTSYTLEESASGGATRDDLEFALPLGVTPDADSNINFFITDPVTGVETQLIPNKVAYYNPAITTNPDLFHFGVGYTYSYTIVIQDAVIREGDDGVIAPITGTTAYISSSAVMFDNTDISGTRTVKILEPATNAGTYAIVGLSLGRLIISNAGGFVSESAAEFRVVDSADSSAMILFTDDLALSAGDALRVTVVDTKDAGFFDVNWTSAYEALEKYECDIVVPLPTQTISAIFQAGVSHVRSMSNVRNRKERMLFIGAIAGLEPNNVIGTEDAAVEDIGILEGIQGDDVSEILAGNIEDLANYGVQNSFGNTYRVVYCYPDEIVVQIGADRTTMPGYFMAPAAAGYLSGLPNIAIPLTNKVLAGFTILRTKLYRPLVLENLSAAGIMVLQPAVGGGRVIWGKTTTNSGEAVEEEISIIFIRDRIAKGLRTGFSGFPGNPEDETTLGSIIVRANKIMQSFISQKIITAFRNLKVGRDSAEPRQWNISVEAQPVFPINWIYIHIGVGVLV